MKQISLIVFISTVLLPLFGCGEQESKCPKVDDPQAFLLGHWRSVKLEGKDAGNFIKEIEFNFGANSNLVAKATMSDGSIDEKRGTFTIDKEKITFVVEGQKDMSKYTVKDDVLVIHDPTLDSRILLKKVKSVKPKPAEQGAEGDAVNRAP